MELARGQANDCANPVLSIFTRDATGWLVDAFAVQFQIFDVSSDENMASPVQVWPAMAGDKESINVEDDCPSGDRLGIGHYVPRYTPAVDAAFGEHEIRWFSQLTRSSPVVEYRERFRVAPSSAGIWNRTYASVAEMRAEGVSAQKASDSVVAAAISLASMYVEQITRWFFGARRMELDVDGHGSRVLALGHPVIAIEAIDIVGPNRFAAPILWTPTRDTVRVYNRHLGGLTAPDDRHNPRLEMLLVPGAFGVLTAWPPGQQNVHVTGVFGYTEPDGSPSGGVPALIRWATRRLALRYVEKQTKLGRIDDLEKRGAVTGEKTRDQSVSYDPSRLPKSVFTGDAAVDQVLLQYRRPAAMAVQSGRAPARGWWS